MKSTRQILIEARAILAKSYIKFYRSDGWGGHCALGALDVAMGDTRGVHEGDECVQLLAAQIPDQEYAEVLAAAGEAAVSWCKTSNLGSKVAGWNNFTDKERTLAIFDAAIAACPKPLDVALVPDWLGIATLQPVVEFKATELEESTS